MKYGESFFMPVLRFFRKRGPEKKGCGVWLAGLLPALVTGLWSCNAVPETGTGRTTDTAGMRALIIATWNVQALFDEEENGKEYTEYRMAAGWSEEKYRTRRCV
jgi:hypothetical protein